MRSPAPAYAEVAADWGALATLTPRDGIEVAFDCHRDDLIATLTQLRDEFEYQQLMEIAGVDFPDRPERFEVVYCLLSLTRNHRIRVHVATDEETAVPSVTGLWPVAGWLEREVYDMYGVFFAGNSDLRRILTDYGFTGHPQRKDFPLTGFQEVRWSEEDKRVVYEPVKLAQDFRTFDFTSPWEGAEYVLPGDEKAALPEAKGAPTPLDAKTIAKADAAQTPRQPAKSSTGGYGKTAESTAETGAGKPGPHAGPEPKSPDVNPTPGKGQNQ